MATEDEIGGRLVTLVAHFIVAMILTSNPYDKKTGLPWPRMRSLGNWLFTNAVLGGVAYTADPFLAAMILAFSIPFTFGVWDANKPENIAAHQLKMAEERARKAAEAAAEEKKQLDELEAQRQQGEAEAAAARLHELEQAHPSVSLEDYKSSTPTQITETARKIAEQLRRR